MKAVGFIVIVLSSLFFLSCLSAPASKTARNTVEIYQYDLSIQCKPDSGIALHEMKKMLIDEGIDVISSRKGSDGKMRISVCGSSTGKLNIYKIDEKDVEKAKKIGFNRISEMSK